MRLKNAYAIILAGGYGTRFWPASRRARPKQFLPLLGRESLLQQTYRRLAKLFPPGRIYVVGNAEHRPLLARQLPRVPPGRLLLEPAGRNTSAAVALAAAHIRAALPAGADAVLGVFPADHGIRREARFLRLARAALATAARDETTVVLGVPPLSPETGFGYIERGRPLRRPEASGAGEQVFAVRRFTEKPSPRAAARYFRSGRYFWNSGMFFWRLSAFDRLLARHLPWSRRAFENLAPAIGTRGYSLCLRRTYRSLENISIDYALAEPAAARDQVRMLEADFGWSDLGSWSAVYDWRARFGRASRRGENIVAGPHWLLDAGGNWLSSPRKFLAVIGARGLIVVETPDALLLCARDRAQDVGKVVDYLKKSKRSRLL